MMKMLKVALASTMLFAGPTLVFAANANDGPDRGETPNGTNAGISDKGRSSEQDMQLKLDDMQTGSIGCQSQTYDEYGNCLSEPNLQEVR
jgi:hypothetical protein